MEHARACPKTLKPLEPDETRSSGRGPDLTALALWSTSGPAHTLFLALGDAAGGVEVLELRRPGLLQTRWRLAGSWLVRPTLSPAWLSLSRLSRRLKLDVFCAGEGLDLRADADLLKCIAVSCTPAQGKVAVVCVCVCVTLQLSCCESVGGSQHLRSALRRAGSPPERASDTAVRGLGGGPAAGCRLLRA